MGGWAHPRSTVVKATLPPPTTDRTKGQTLLQPNRRKLGQLCWCHPLLPLTPSIPYLLPCTRARARRFRRSCVGRNLAPLPTQSPAVAQRRKVWVQGLPCLVSLCPFRAILHPGPRPPFGSRLGRYDLSPFSTVSTPRSGAVDHRPASAWQLRLVSLCRLVRRASIPSCAASPQARRSGKNAQHKQINSPSTAAQRR